MACRHRQTCGGRPDRGRPGAARRIARHRLRKRRAADRGRSLARVESQRPNRRTGYKHEQAAWFMTSPAPSVDTADPMLQKIVDALEAIRAEEFDYEILRAAADVMGEDV